MKKGFTLIELLAVIVILAIIALIAVPIILEVINNTKEEATIRSAENYLKAVELSITTSSMHTSIKEINGTYEIIDGGKRVQKVQGSLIEIDYDGEGLESGTILVKDGKIKSVKNAKIGNLFYVKSLIGNTMILDEEPEDVTLIDGKNFNIAIKTLVGNEQTVDFDTIDKTVKTIEFFSYGKLPDGYTLKELQVLESTNLSLKKDNKITAYYDGNGKIFIYSEGLINFNETSNYMFYRFNNMESIIFNEIDTSNVSNILGMFNSCQSLTSLDLSNFDTSNVKNMSYMFHSCSKLTSLDISNFDTTLVTTMKSMFYNSKKLKCIKVGDKWTTENKNITDMFTSCGVSSVTKDSCPGV